MRGNVNVEEAKALVEPDITGIQRRQRQQILFMLLIIYSVFTPLRKASRGGPCPAKGGLGSGSLSAPDFVHSLGGRPFQSSVPQLPTLSVSAYTWP